VITYERSIAWACFSTTRNTVVRPKHGLTLLLQARLLGLLHIVVDHG
jgi:hypothetical protein